MTEARREQAVAYLLGEMDPPAAAEFERRMASDHQLRAEVDRLAPITQRLRELPPEAWADEDPPPLKLPVTEPARASAPQAAARWRAWLAPRRVALAGAVALGVFAGAIAITNEVGDDPEPVVASIDLLPLEGSPNGATGEVELAADRTRTEVIVDGLPPSQPGTFYELWLLQGEETVSLGSFTVGADGHADTTVPLPVDPASYDVFDVSLEREDGDPTHSGQSVLRGPTALS